MFIEIRISVNCSRYDTGGLSETVEIALPDNIEVSTATISIITSQVLDGLIKQHKESIETEESEHD